MISTRNYQGRIPAERGNHDRGTRRRTGSKLPRPSTWTISMTICVANYKDYCEFISKTTALRSRTPVNIVFTVRFALRGGCFVPLLNLLLPVSHTLQETRLLFGIAANLGLNVQRRGYGRIHRVMGGKGRESEGMGGALDENLNCLSWFGYFKLRWEGGRGFFGVA